MLAQNSQYVLISKGNIRKKGGGAVKSTAPHSPFLVVKVESLKCKELHLITPLHREKREKILGICSKPLFSELCYDVKSLIVITTTSISYIFCNSKSDLFF